MNGNLYLTELKKIIKNKEVIDEYINMSCNEHPNETIKNFKFIRTVSKPLTQQIGGKIQNVTYNGKEFIVDMTVQQAEKGDDYYSIYYFNMDIKSFKCSIIQINKKKKEAFITGLSNYDACIMCKDKTYEYKKGEILMKIMIELCVKKNIKNIKLTDNSKIDCKGLNDKFELIIFRTMTHGEPYYIKFGFLPETEKNIKIYENNKKLFKTLIFDRDKIITILNNNIDNINNNDTKFIIKQIKQSKLYKLQHFVKYIYDHYPIILHDIYMELYNISGYKPYSSKIFVKNML